MGGSDTEAREIQPAKLLLLSCNSPSGSFISVRFLQSANTSLPNIVGYGYAGKAVARTESGFAYTFECGGQGEFLQVVAVRKSVILDVFHSFGQKDGGQAFAIGKGVLSYASQCVRKFYA